MDVVLVTGVPRSGTSLAMQMLAAGGVEPLCDDARPPDADNPRGYFELGAVKRSARDTTWLEAAAGRAVKVVHSLVGHLPRDRRYRVVLMRRDWREVLASQRAMLARRGEEPGSLSDARLAEVFEAQLRELEALLRSDPAFGLLVLDYAELVADPASGAARLDAFLGGGLDREAMAAAVDPALRRQRAPAAATSAPKIASR